MSSQTPKSSIPGYPQNSKLPFSNPAIQTFEAGNLVCAQHIKAETLTTYSGKLLKITATVVDNIMLKQVKHALRPSASYAHLFINLIRESWLL